MLPPHSLHFSSWLRPASPRAARGTLDARALPGAGRTVVPDGERVGAQNATPRWIGHSAWPDRRGARPVRAWHHGAGSCGPERSRARIKRAAHAHRVPRANREGPRRAHVAWDSAGLRGIRRESCRGSRDGGAAARGRRRDSPGHGGTRRDRAGFRRRNKLSRDTPGHRGTLRRGRRPSSMTAAAAARRGRTERAGAGRRRSRVAWRHDFTPATACAPHHGAG